MPTTTTLDWNAARRTHPGKQSHPHRFFTIIQHCLGNTNYVTHWSAASSADDRAWWGLGSFLQASVRLLVGEVKTKTHEWQTLLFSPLQIIHLKHPPPILEIWWKHFKSRVWRWNTFPFWYRRTMIAQKPQKQENDRAATVFKSVGWGRRVASQNRVYVNN